MKKFREFVNSLIKAGFSPEFIWGSYLNQKSKFKVTSEQARFIILESFSSSK